MLWQGCHRHDSRVLYGLEKFQVYMHWKLKLAKHDCIIKHIPGKESIIADAFSRIHKITTQN